MSLGPVAWGSCHREGADTSGCDSLHLCTEACSRSDEASPRISTSLPCLGTHLDTSGCGRCLKRNKPTQVSRGRRVNQGQAVRVLPLSVWGEQLGVWHWCEAHCGAVQILTFPCWWWQGHRSLWWGGVIYLLHTVASGSLSPPHPLLPVSTAP